MPSHPCILKHPQRQGDKVRSGCLTPALSGAQKRAELLPQPVHSRGCPKKAVKVKSGCLNLALSGAQKMAEMLLILAFSGNPKNRGGQMAVAA